MADKNINIKGGYRIDLRGERVGRLLVIGFSKSVKCKGGSRVFWFCQCDCGNKTEVRADAIRSRRPIQSCGCLGIEHARTLGYRNRGLIRTPEQRERNRQAKLANPIRYWLGKSRSSETAAKIRATKIANRDSVGSKNPMYRDGGTRKTCPQCAGGFYVPTSTQASRRFCSFKCKGDWMSEHLRVNPPKIRAVREYKRWRISVLERDGHTCQMCGVSKTNDAAVILHADHILPLLTHPELAYDIKNGRCLCRSCHFSLPTHGGKGRRWPQSVAA